MYLKTKNSLHKTRISSFNYVSIVFLEKNQMLKYTFANLGVKLGALFPYPSYFQPG